MKTIDINCDMGESYGNYHIGNDQAIFPYITSSNIACGFHGGDPVHMEKTIKGAIQHQVQVGAHPGFPDLPGFGRRNMDLVPDELKAVIKYQLAAIKGMAESLGTTVKYVKPHGALYNLAADDENISRILIEATREISDDFLLMGLAGSLFQEICHAENMAFVAEAFADRTYESNGRLRSRSLDGSVLTDPEAVTDQVLNMVVNQQISTYDGSPLTIQPQSICIHGDNPAAVTILKALQIAFDQHGIAKKNF